MTISEMLEEFESLINEAATDRYGNAVIRGFTVWKYTVLYLIANDQLELSDHEYKFWEYIETYTPSALYKVANHYRRENDEPRLNYTQSIYHLPQQKRDEVQS